MAYKLELTPYSKIQPAFHVSCLKKFHGQLELVEPQIPPVEQLAHPPFLQAMLGARMHNNSNKLLVHWEGLSPAEACWEDIDSFG